jgi:hypothetical protein
MPAFCDQHRWRVGMRHRRAYWEWASDARIDPASVRHARVAAWLDPAARAGRADSHLARERARARAVGVAAGLHCPPRLQLCGRSLRDATIEADVALRSLPGLKMAGGRLHGSRNRRTRALTEDDTGDSHISIARSAAAMAPHPRTCASRHDAGTETGTIRLSLPADRRSLPPALRPAPPKAAAQQPPSRCACRCWYAASPRGAPRSCRGRVPWRRAWRSAPP